MNVNSPGADPGFLKGGGVHFRSTSKKKGGPRGGTTLGPMLKSLHHGPKGGAGPPGPPLGPLLRPVVYIPPLPLAVIGARVSFPVYT